MLYCLLFDILAVFCYNTVFQLCGKFFEVLGVSTDKKGGRICLIRGDVMSIGKSGIRETTRNFAGQLTSSLMKGGEYPESEVEKSTGRMEVGRVMPPSWK